MTLQIELDRELEGRLVHAAHARGLKPEEYVQQLLDESLALLESGTGGLTRETFSAMLREMAAGSEQLPELPDEAFARDAIYGEHP